MLAEFLNKTINSFFQKQEEIPVSIWRKSYLKRWKVDFHLFFEDTFRKWVASRSGESVNYLLDKGLSSSDEQMIVKKLEKDSWDYSISSWMCFSKSLFFPPKLILLFLMFSLMTLVFPFIYSSDVIWKLSFLCQIVACLSGAVAGILFFISKKYILIKSKRFVTRFFEDAERMWGENQEQQIEQIRNAKHA
ncbi:MAG: hypothetical protein ACI4SG_05965 [Oligosphaeraceae bacterium]